MSETPAPWNAASADRTKLQAMRDYQRQRQMTLGDLLLENRVIFLQGEIYDGNANELVMKLLYLQSENRRKDIHFYINSPGGSVTATLAIYDTMQHISAPVNTICMGMAASAGSFLLAAGERGKRAALPHARIMLHQPSSGTQGTAADIEIAAKEILYLRDKLNDLYASHTGQTAEKIKADLDRDLYMSATEATAIEIASKTETPSMKGGSPTAFDRLIVSSRFSDQSASATLKTRGRSEARGIL